ncbi:MAG: (Fe-S)-binding protein [Anaeromyxobacteraceae bacterium]
MNPWITAFLLAAAGGFFAFTMQRRLAPLWAFRKDDRLDRPGERVRALLRFGFGQARLPDRGEVWPGLLHVLIFAAFVVLGARTITLFGMGFSRDFHLPLLGPGTPTGDAYGFVKDVMVLAALFAALAFIWRRLVTKPDRVTRSWEGVLILGFIAGLMVTEILFEGAERVAARQAWSSALPAGSIGAEILRGLDPSAVHAVGVASFWLHLLIVLVFLNFLPFGKHFHVITALPDVYVQRLPPKGALRKLDLESETPDYGARTVNDLSWKEGLDTYSCTECGRCQTFCPTYVTGKPLSHKEVNRTLRHHLQEKAPALVAVARAADAAAREAAVAALPAVVGNVLPEATIWACTTCGWCETACPVLIEQVPRLVDLRRHQVLVESAFPEEAARVFKNIETQGNPWGIGSNRRAEWCEDLAVPRASEGDFEWLFFVGCAGAFDDRQKKVSRAIVKILRAAKVKFAILGEEETCNGETARRLGNEYLYQMQASANVELMKGYGVKKVITQCPHCLNTIKNEFPQFGGAFEVVHHSELIARLVADGKLAPGAAKAFEGQTVTFHDPCYLARWNGVTEAPRAALASVPGLRVLEMERNRDQGFCCGAGGGRMWLEEKLGTRINQDRVEEASRVLGAKGGVVAAGCPFCLTMLKDGVAELGKEETMRVVDLAEIVAAGLPEETAEA